MERHPLCVEMGCRYALDLGAPDSCVGWCRYQRQQAEFEEHERKYLAMRRCPHSGERLTRDGNAGPERLSCWVCDCFGYRPDEVG